MISCDVKEANNITEIQTSGKQLKLPNQKWTCWSKKTKQNKINGFIERKK